MTNDAARTTRTLVVQDTSGDDFLVPQQALERGRGPAAHTAERERIMAEAGADTQGFILPLVYGIAMTAGFAAGYFGTKAALGPEAHGPDLSDVPVSPP